MNILFVNPNPYKLGNKKIKLSILDKILNQMHFYPSLTFPMLASITPKDHFITFIDELDYQQNINFDGEYDLVGITCKTYASPRAYEIADEFRIRGITVVLGGYHPSALPDEAKQHADSVVIGEAEDIWPQLVIDFENGKLKPFYYQEKPVDLNDIPYPNRKIFNKKFTQARIEATRGCPVGCNFCAITNRKFGKTFRMRPVNKVINEIASRPEKFLFFYDSALTVYVKYTKQLFAEMKGLNKTFYALGNIAMLGKDEEFLKIASEAGCAGWNVGFDSICQDSLKGINKTTNRVSEYKQAIKKIHDYGMEVNASLIFGFDQDKTNIFKDSLSFIYESSIDWAAFQILTPLPGTPLFQRLNQEKRIFTTDWEKYDFEHVVFQPKNMTPEELQTGFRSTFDEYNVFKNQLKIILKNIDKGFIPMISKGQHFFDIRYRKQYGRYWK